MYRQTQNLPGIIGVLQINGNGFYPVSNIDLENFVNTKECRINVQTVEYPVEIVLIAQQEPSYDIYKQNIIIKNIPQIRYAYQTFSRYAIIVPASCLNESGLNIPNNQIVDETVLDDL